MQEAQVPVETREHALEEHVYQASQLSANYIQVIAHNFYPQLEMWKVRVPPAVPEAML